MITNIDIDEALITEHAVFIDVRSPKEFEEDHIPGAVNIPLYQNEEREQIGTVYKKTGPKEARKLGLEIVAPKLPDLVKTIEEISKQGKPVLYCWRGGMRSLSLATVLDLMNIHVYRLKGGYKHFRRWVYDFFQQESLPYKIFVLHGLTGTGKTEVIKKLSCLGAAVVDLEGLANHKGSVFGSVGLAEQPSQKYFESMVYYHLLQNRKKKFLVVECESRRIGRLIIPQVFFEGMKNGRHILIYDTMENRINRIMCDYDVNNNREALIEGLCHLKRCLGGEKISRLTGMLQEGKYESVIEDLLVNYYDVLYKYPDQPSTRYELSINSYQPEQAAKEIFSYLSQISQKI